MSAVPLQEPLPQHFSHPLSRYWAATRPAFLTLTVVACILGAALAQFHHATDFVLLLWAMLGAMLLHAAANVINDVADAHNGTDSANERRLFPFTGGSRFIQNQVLTIQQMTLFGGGLLLAATAIGAYLWWQRGSGVVLWGLIGAGLAWAYSMPPLRLNSRGFGELCVWLGFALLPMGCAWVAGAPLSSTVLAAGSSFGGLAMVLLYLNQFPDREADRLAGKRHWVVRLPLAVAAAGYGVLVAIAYAILLSAILYQILPVWTGLAALPLPLSLFAWQQLLRHAAQPQALRPAIIATLLATHLSPLLLALGLWLHVFFPI